MKYLKLFEEFGMPEFDFNLATEDLEQVLMCDYIEIDDVQFVRYEIVHKIVSEYGKKVYNDTLNIKYDVEATLKKLESLLKRGYDLTHTVDKQQIPQIIALDVLNLADDRFINENFVETMITKIGKKKRDDALKMN